MVPGRMQAPFAVLLKGCNGSSLSEKRASRKPTELRLINHETSAQTTEIAVSTTNSPLGTGRTVYESHQLRWFVRLDYGLQGFDICVHMINYAPKMYL